MEKKKYLYNIEILALPTENQCFSIKNKDSFC